MPRRTKRVLTDEQWLLHTGARWRDIPIDLPSGSTCWPRLQDWAGEEVRAPCVTMPDPGVLVGPGTVAFTRNKRTGGLARLLPARRAAPQLGRLSARRPLLAETRRR